MYKCAGLNELITHLNKWQEDKGFRTPKSIDEVDLTLAKLMLVVSEIGEAAEAVRHNDRANFGEELADAIIRILNISGPLQIDMEEEIERKMLINDNRPHLHGKVC